MTTSSTCALVDAVEGVAAALLAAATVATVGLTTTMTDDVHRAMFGMLAVALAVAAILIVRLTAR